MSEAWETDSDSNDPRKILRFECDLASDGAPEDEWFTEAFLEECDNYRRQRRAVQRDVLAETSESDPESSEEEQQDDAWGLSDDDGAITLE